MSMHHYCTYSHSNTLTHTSLAGGGPPKLIHMIHSSEYPQTTFAVLDSMKCLVGENSLDTIFGNLRQFYNPKKGQKIEVKGYCYEAKGYVVKIGSIVIGSTNKGLIVEVSFALLQGFLLISSWSLSPPFPPPSLSLFLLPSLFHSLTHTHTNSGGGQR